MDGTPPVSASQLDAPYSERWDLLKDVIESLYVGEKKKVAEIVQIMRTEYQFYAAEPQYKGKFKVWGIKKALPTSKKEKIVQSFHTRAQSGKRSRVLHKGKEEDEKIRRYMKQTQRDAIAQMEIRDGHVDIEDLSGHGLQCGNRVFMNFSMPAAVLHFLVDHVSPYASARSPMSDILVVTPTSNVEASPQNHPSPGNHLSLSDDDMTIAVKESSKISRAQLFLEKRHTDLLRGMSLAEQCITTDWLHQFWQYSFKTAKEWGHGPLLWNASSLQFNDFHKAIMSSLPGIPMTNICASVQNSNHRAQGKSPSTSNVQQPSDLCRWSIHVYQEVASPQPAEDMVIADDEHSCKPWGPSVPSTIHDFVDRLQENLENNKFSTVDTNDLPIAWGQISKAARRSPDQLMEEAFGFSIMARNLDLIDSMMIEYNDPSRGCKAFLLHDLYPLHLASSYLDGSKTCCVVFHEIVDGMAHGDGSIDKLYINHLNHTVLDNLMIAILKGHTTCTPIMVDDAFKTEQRFAGEEVDICGRWDADSDCIRDLHARGSPTIPRSWKHVFCHTSIQTVTHCIGTLFGPHWAPDINTPSGLFLKRCPNENCMLRLQLKPLHTLVVTAVYLAQLGSDGETLFGMIACLLCLLGKGANPLQKAHISLDLLLKDDGHQNCTHFNMDPLELALKVPWEIICNWPKERITGWKILCAVLRLSQDEWNRQPGSKVKETAPDVSSSGFKSVYGVFAERINEEMAVVDLANMDVDTHSEEDEEEIRLLDEEMISDDEDNGGVPTFCSQHIDGDQSPNFFGKSVVLATLWAAIQTELLTYRRIDEEDPWVSANFGLASLLENLEKGEMPSIRLVSEGLMNEFCGCGIMCGSEDAACLRVDEASAYHFSNLEDDSRTTFLDAFVDRQKIWTGSCC